MGPAEFSEKELYRQEPEQQQRSETVVLKSLS
jgi:hypothetical protein